MTRILTIFVAFVILIIGASVLFFSSNSINGDLLNITGGESANGGGVAKPDDAVEISIIYAPEEELYIVDAIRDFNQRYADGVNPLTGDSLAGDERPIFVVGRAGSSGTIHQGIINAVIAPNNANVEKPTIFSPSVSHWLALVNYQTGQQVFDLADSPPTALAPVVMAIWESRLRALEEANGGQPVGWEELIEVLNHPEGWGAYGIPGRKTVYYGHTDPYISSTALSTLIAEFYASGRYNSDQPDFRRLTTDIVDDERVQQGVRDIESMIKHYSSRTTEFKEYIAQGPDYLDFVALEENDLIYINQGKTNYKPPEKLVALYPKEGTFWHEHPFGIPATDWVTDEQRAAAKVFTEYVRSEPVQQMVMESGFRPANLSVEIGYPFVAELGVDPLQPTTVLDAPAPDVIASVQASWQFVKKQADILLVVDISGSMEGDKIEQARDAAQLFLDKLPPQNRVSLVTFEENAVTRVPLASFETVETEIRNEIDGLRAEGGTALFDAILAAASNMQQNDDGERIRAIVVLSDGQDTSSASTLRDVTSLTRGERNPLLVFPVAYGRDADISSLNNIARTFSTKVLSGDPDGIEELFALLSSYF
ncbi:VWA domain-containing protein [Chloroflexi bacterium TSY]|nr:VWA domain-containing protein [Chloroflexi bacterium TSY]